uniref:NADH-ubiquinone oxidoreductase chain 4L n=1 Tax=Velarifictorus hemelytrus TaxID=1874760 RepID=A0A1B1SHN8_9ORTH|nr:NADH dehydrogenase subunit 4L [Velarifictorus hemelytrus]ANU83251.1 NADH dehydrogenase subunit 4L [Velarifictorus hemelytrus]
MLTFLCLMMVVICYLSGVWIYCSKRKHLLIILLSLEYMVLFTFFLLIYWLSGLQFELFLSMIYLVFAVCEGSLGLGILVSMVRSHGNDFFQSFVVLRC